MLNPVTARGAVFAAWFLLSPAAGMATELATPGGPVVLTVTGNITQTNRGPFDDFEDAFLKHHERRFQKAAAFDLAMLEGLGMHDVVIEYGETPVSRPVAMKTMNAIFPADRGPLVEHDQIELDIADLAEPAEFFYFGSL